MARAWLSLGQTSGKPGQGLLHHLFRAVLEVFVACLLQLNCCGGRRPALLFVELAAQTPGQLPVRLGLVGGDRNHALVRGSLRERGPGSNDHVGLVEPLETFAVGTAERPSFGQLGLGLLARSREVWIDLFLASPKRHGETLLVKILLEGRPGIGKTTVVRRLTELLRDAGLVLGGFVTEELREGRRRVGFSVETLDGGRAVLAHVDLAGPPRVGKYGVDLAAFERLALPALARAEKAEFVVIDELGKMELASAAFRAAVADLFEQPARILATVQIARNPLTDELKGRADVETVRASAANRGELPARLAERILARASCPC